MILPARVGVGLDVEVEYRLAFSRSSRRRRITCSTIFAKIAA